MQVQYMYALSQNYTEKSVLYIPFTDLSMQNISQNTSTWSWICLSACGQNYIYSRECASAICHFHKKCITHCIFAKNCPIPSI